MKSKKSKQANLESRKGMFRQMGIILALGLTFIAFEYSNADVSAPNLDYESEVIVEQDYVPITQEKVKLPPPPPILLDQIVIDMTNLTVEEEIVIPSLDEEDIADIPIFPDDTEEEIDPHKIFVSAEQMPEFPGGESALFRYLSENVRYPSIAMEMGIQGRVYIEFVVNKTGKITQISLLKGVDRYLDEETLRVVKKMPHWTPGYQGGKPVNVSYRIPVNFVLK